MAKYVTISIASASKIIIDRLALKYEMSQKDFAEAMINFFDKTGLNPKDVEVLSVAEELNKFRNTIISFLRKQEKDFILPAFGQMNTVMVRFKDYLDNEAPTRVNLGSQTKTQPLSLKVTSEGETIAAQPKVVEQPVASNSEELEKLKEDYKKLELKFSTTKQYLERILDNTSLKSTGMDRKSVIELPVADINDYRSYLKRL